mmetsp:Transcript_4369/g.10202  ORF Transcript_4369/g.10202 Transcript_4369/m.10202 type:complete len:86 (+) Transcript_4369:993-1250(+)
MLDHGVARAQRILRRFFSRCAMVVYLQEACLEDSFCPQYWYILHGVFCLTMLTLEFPSLPSMVPFSFPACFVGQTLLLKELSEPE